MICGKHQERESQTSRQWLGLENSFAQPYMPLYQYASSLHCSCGTYKDNLSNNQELIEFVIISFISMTLMLKVTRMKEMIPNNRSS